MRLRHATGGPNGLAVEQFAQELLDLGEGKLQDRPIDKVVLSCVNVHSFMLPEHLIHEVVNHLYHGIANETTNGSDQYMNYLSNRCILTPLNVDS
jgi:hypothetical protein